MHQSKCHFLSLRQRTSSSFFIINRRNLSDCSAIDSEEKIGIKRTLLLESFAEPVPQIAIQMAVLIGNISRLDYPNDWEDVSRTVVLPSYL